MRRSDGYFCAIEIVENGYEHVGNISVSIDLNNKLADISIMIGERQAWAAGLGFEAWNGVLRALLDREGLRKVTAGAAAPNQAMIRIMEKSGMNPDGRRQAHYLINGEAVDVVHYASFSDKAC
jgi:RimJ/RimL family protein N-acetyltransferase